MEVWKNFSDEAEPQKGTSYLLFLFHSKISKDKCLSSLILESPSLHFIQDKSPSVIAKQRGSLTRTLGYRQSHVRLAILGSVFRKFHIIISSSVFDQRGIPKVHKRVTVLARRRGNIVLDLYTKWQVVPVHFTDESLGFATNEKIMVIHSTSH